MNFIFILFIHFLMADDTTLKKYKSNIVNLEIHYIKNSQIDWVYLLKNNMHETIAKLDCNSFLMGVTTKLHSKDHFFYLYENECLEIRDYLKIWSYHYGHGLLYLDFDHFQWHLEKGH